jgi:hypothetical protein
MDLEKARDRAVTLLESDDYLALVQRQIRDGSLPADVHAALWHLAFGPAPSSPLRVVKRPRTKAPLALVKRDDVMSREKPLP